MPYKHFGARLARLGRFDSCTLYQIVAPVVQRTRTVGLQPTDAGSTPERRTKGRISSKVEPAIDNREELVRFQHPAPSFPGDWQRWLMHSPLKRDQGWFDSSVTHQGLRDWQMRLCTRLLSETKQVRFLHPAPGFVRGRFIQLDQDRAF